MYIKYFNDVDHRKSFKEGNIILRDYNYYRSSKEQNGDSNEFSVSKAGSTHGLTNDAFILSASQELSKCLRNKFGDHFLIIKDPMYFFDMLKKKLLPVLKFPQISNFGKISYYQTSTQDRLSEIEYFNKFPNEDVNSSVHIPFRKSSAYAEEKEIRMCFFYDIEKIKNFDAPDVTFRFFKRMPYSNEFYKQHTFEPDKQGYLNKKYMRRFLSGDQEVYYVEFDSCEDYQCHFSNYNTFNYYMEYYVEAHLKLDTPENYI